MESRLSPESENILHVESGILGFGILGFGIRTTVQGIRNPNDDWNPESKFHWQRLESSICWNPESTVWNPESKTVLDRPFHGFFSTFGMEKKENPSKPLKRAH